MIYFSCCQESSNPVVVSSELNIKGGCAHTGENAGNRRKEAGEGGKVGEGEQSGEGGAEGKRGPTAYVVDGGKTRDQENTNDDDLLDEGIHEKKTDKDDTEAVPSNPQPRGISAIAQVQRIK